MKIKNCSFCGKEITEQDQGFEGENGFIVDPYDADEFANIYEQLKFFKENGCSLNGITSPFSFLALITCRTPNNFEFELINGKVYIDLVI